MSTAAFECTRRLIVRLVFIVRVHYFLFISWQRECMWVWVTSALQHKAILGVTALHEQSTVQRARETERRAERQAGRGVPMTKKRRYVLMPFDSREINSPEWYAHSDSSFASSSSELFVLDIVSSAPTTEPPRAPPPDPLVSPVGTRALIAEARCSGLLPFF